MKAHECAHNNIQVALPVTVLNLTSFLDKEVPMDMGRQIDSKLTASSRKCCLKIMLLYAVYSLGGSIYSRLDMDILG